MAVFYGFPNIRSVGVMGDARTYDHTIGIRAVTSIDGMTSDWARIPWEVLEVISTRIVNEVNHVTVSCTILQQAACNYRVGIIAVKFLLTNKSLADIVKTE